MAGKNLGTGTIAVVATVTAILSTSPSHITVIPVSTGGWAMGGAGVCVSSTPTDTEIPADADPTGFYLGGGFEAISAIPPSDEIVTEVGFLFCGPGVTGAVVSTDPQHDLIPADVATIGFALGGAGVWSQVKPEDLPSTVLVGSGGFVFSGSGLTTDPAVTPTATVLVGTGGFKLGGRRPDLVEVTYPDSIDRTIAGPSGYGFEMGGEGVLESTTPAVTLIVSSGAIFALGGAGLAVAKMPPIAVITGDALGGFVLAGATPAEVFEAWVLNGQAFEPSVFSGFDFNSFAQHRGQTYAAGDAGIYLLGAETDAGETIHTGTRIGPVNFGADRDKRIRGIQYGQGGMNTRIRVRSENGDVGVFEPGRDENRVVVSRDIQGRQFTIDIMDFEELSGIEITPLRLARR